MIRRLRQSLTGACLALLLAACQSPTTPLDAREIDLAANDLRSLAAESALLTEQLASGSVTENYAWVHQEALGQASVELAGRLARPVPKPSQRRHEQLLQLHAGYDVALERVGFSAHDAPALQQLQRRFLQIRDQVAPPKEAQ
jgi:hypothetical protein